jgi:hypothetical protein
MATGIAQPETENRPERIDMKKATIAALVGLAAAMLFSGCLLIQLGGGSTTKPQTPTVGQQLTDLKKAKDAGALTDAEYQAQRAKILDQQ